MTWENYFMGKQVCSKLSLRAGTNSNASHGPDIA
jgi:hypothetical protein